MSQERGMFRIYKCTCNNTGIARVDEESEVSSCSFCGAEIHHEDGMPYAATKDEAMELVKELVMFSRKTPARQSRRGIGVKKRVYYIIESIIETNRGRPATKESVLRECSGADIPQERTEHFLDVLENEGLVAKSPEGLAITGGLE